ncbi:MAG: hypothetical protein VX513_00605 [Pseudomonadota bacterium]|nr:hypothetical protein [Pseudomonadota bacterium]
MIIKFPAILIVLGALIGCGGGGGSAQSPSISNSTDNANIRLEVANGSGTELVSAGSVVNIAAGNPETNYYFSHWSSQDGGTFANRNDPNTTFTVPNTNPVNIRANFLPGVAPEADVSVARRWNEVLLQAIRNDFARPVVHARNLFHISSAMYDSWTAFGQLEQPWLLGDSSIINCEFTNINSPLDHASARAEAISYASYRLIRHRFLNSPGAQNIALDAEALMGFFDYDIDNTSTDYSDGSAAALGNFIAECYINLGLVDGSNEANFYTNQHYEPVNRELRPEISGNPLISDLNRWQPLHLIEFRDQAGNPAVQAPGTIINNTEVNRPEFLGAEWGSVLPFALAQEDLTINTRDGFDYWVYHDPGEPPTFGSESAEDFHWSFAVVAAWSSHLDPADGIMMDISPASLGNISSYPTSPQGYPTFYDIVEGGDSSQGYEVNPATGTAYEPQIVPRGDYTRVLAEFWADGPESETPPGHWFVILNEVNDHPLLLKRFAGSGPVLDDLEWDVKSYFTLGGAMHDAAITAWGIKGWYDYIRPISALRALAALGQSTDPNAASYNPDGMPLYDGLIELVEADDSVSGFRDEHVGKIKFRAWQGPDFIEDPNADVAGVQWILAEDWWPYQRPTFVTPPFAGYVSGHSTYSRAAAEVLTAITGDPFFPGGMSEFEISKDEFLVFEDGPSVDMTLQWATYRDAADQCGLSRIWGGLHPPADDIPGRLIGIEVGEDAFRFAKELFDGAALP